MVISSIFKFFQKFIGFDFFWLIRGDIEFGVRVDVEKNDVDVEFCCVWMLVVFLGYIVLGCVVERGLLLLFFSFV